jgi:hypothetical protein
MKFVLEIATFAKPPNVKNQSQKVIYGYSPFLKCKEKIFPHKITTLAFSFVS